MDSEGKGDTSKGRERETDGHSEPVYVTTAGRGNDLVEIYFSKTDKSTPTRKT